MAECVHCRTQIHDQSRFCSFCGQPTGGSGPINSVGRQLGPTPVRNHLATVSHSGFGQLFGLDPRVAFLTVAVDAMLFGGVFVTMGASALLSVPAGIAWGFITYKAQRHWYGDDRESALIKGLIVGLLTAIPTGLPGFLTIPSGVVGLAHLLRRKKTGNALVIDQTVRG